MKALLYGGAGLMGLLLFSSVSFGYVWVSPVFKQTYPVAPSLYNTPAYYSIDAYGRFCGPCYYLMPPGQPFNGILPGQVGQSIMAGNLPHTLLLSKQGMDIGNVPLLNQKQKGSSHDQEPQGSHMFAAGGNQMGYPTPPMAPMPNMQIPYGQVPPMQIPYGQVPHMQIPYGQAPQMYPMHPMQIPHSPPPQMQPMQPFQQMPNPAPGGGQRPGQIAYHPMSYGNYYYYDPRAGIWQAQAPGTQPFGTIPGFTPNLPPTPQAPMMPVPPGGPMMPPPYGPGPNTGFNYFQPMQPLQPMQPMGPPMSRFDPLQLPRMEGTAPPPMKVGGNAYPTHPFIRSPRDFFMWGENMQDEERARRRPFPTP